MTAAEFEMQGHSNTLSHLAALEQRVSSLETGIRDIATAVTALATKIDNGNRTPWSIIWSALGVGLAVLVSIGGLAYAPVVSGLAKLDRDMDRHEVIFYPRTEAERGRQVNDRVIEKIERRLEKLEDRKP